MTESEQLKSLIISTASALWEDKDTLGKFLDVVRRSETFAPLADSMEQCEVRPAKPTFYGVTSTEFQAVVRRSETFAPLADSMEQCEVRPAKPTFYGVTSTEFQE